MKILRWASTLCRAAALPVVGLSLAHCFTEVPAAATGSDSGESRNEASSDAGESHDGATSDSGAARDAAQPDGGATSHGLEAGGADTGEAGDAGPPSKDVVKTCLAQDNVTVGSYVVETNYWNQTGCPGTQCVSINHATGAFTVTEGPNCDNTVASYPNVLYGSSFGESSPGSALPKQVSALTQVTSSWSFSVGGAATDMFDVAYDIWFCPDDTCGPNGFNGGAELMIWLNHPNTTNGGVVATESLDGYSWQLSTAAAGGTGNTWTYIAYMIQPPMVTSVTDLNLLSFFKDAESRGYIQSSWYLYAVQAGIELRTGGIPFTNNSFSVSVN
jgi:hypothetical protein